MVKMEKRMMSSVNPFVGAKYPVHCSCCDSEVGPAMTIERGYAVEAVSLVEAIDPPITKPMTMIEILEADGSNEVVNDANASVTMNMLSKTGENADRDIATKEGTATPMNIAAQEAEVVSDNVETEGSVTDCKEGENTTGLVKTETAEFESFSSEKSVNIFDEEVDQESCVDEHSDDEFEASDADKVQATCLVPQSVCRKIRQAIDKARLCLAKINCITSKNLQNLSREQNKHAEAIKKLTIDNLADQEVHVVEELSMVSEELIKNMEYLNRQTLDCQQSRLVEIITTLKQDIEKEMSSMQKIEDQVKEQLSDEIEKRPSHDSLMTFLKDAPWTSFGFISLLVANLGYFSQPWLLQSFHACSVRCLGYFRNSTIFQ